MRNLCVTQHIVRTQAVLSLICTKLYRINPRRYEFKVQDNAVLLQILQLYIMSMFLSCFLPLLWFDISFGGDSLPHTAGTPNLAHHSRRTKSCVFSTRVNLRRGPPFLNH